MKKRVKRAVTIADLVAASHSRGQVNKIIIAIDDDQKKFDQLMRIFLGKDPELARRAAWALSYIVIKHPGFITKWFPKILANVKIPDQHPAIYRNTFRFLEVINIPEVHAAAVLDASYHFISDARFPPAIRAFAMTSAMNVVRSYPEPAPELKVVVTQVMTEESPAIRSRGRRILAEIEKCQFPAN